MQRFYFKNAQEMNLNWVIRLSSPCWRRLYICCRCLCIYLMLICIPGGNREGDFGMDWSDTLRRDGWSIQVNNTKDTFCHSVFGTSLEAGSTLVPSVCVHRWVDRSPLLYTHWATGEPNNANGEEHCAQMNRHQGKRSLTVVHSTQSIHTESSLDITPIHLTRIPP